MVQPSRVFTLWERLYRRFSIEPVPAQSSETPGVLTTIQPITDADELLRTPTATAFTSLDLSGTIGGFISIYTGAAGVRAHLKNVHREATIANSQIAIRIGGSGGVIFYLTILATAEQVWVGDITLDEGDQLGVIATGNAGDDTQAADFYFESEDLF